MKINLQARNNGIFLGVILIVFTLVLSYVNPKVFLTTRSFLLIVPFIIILVKNAFDIRRQDGGYIKFKKLFLDSFTCAVVAIAMCTAFEYFLFNNIYPELKEVYKQVGMEALEQSKGFFSEEMIEKSKEQFENENMYGFAEIISLFFTRLLAPGVILSVIIAGILRKNKPTLNT